MKLILTISLILSTLIPVSMISVNKKISKVGVIPGIEYSELVIHTLTSEGVKLDFDISIVFKKVSKSYKNDLITIVKKCVKMVVLNTSTSDIESVEVKIKEELIKQGVEIFHVTCKLTSKSEFFLSRGMLDKK